MNLKNERRVIVILESLRYDYRMNMIPIIYENEEILIINKPAGLAVQGGQGVVHSVDRDFSEQLGYKIYLVHRLDKDTSGLMVVAKNPVAAAKWTKLIGSKVVKKEYIAVCAGTMPKKSGVINETIIQHGETKTAVTHYEVLKEWEVTTDCHPELVSGSIFMCELRLILETGRMHQIRIHLAKNNCPIAGDDQHGNFKLNKLLKKSCGIKRLQLTAVRLTIPLNGKEKVFEIPVEV